MTTAPTIRRAHKAVPRTFAIRKTSLRALAVAAHLERPHPAPRPRRAAPTST
ncbi:MAG: hypothetical protein QOE54_3245 [Streptosporangiaceae bacterium]|jgi:hypothetical protein|nr:hypothetical protein [Streptosporangiaceae bacterium]MDX6430879.1 hypothetical protein [Streptosporangiaceae bacterium]